MTLDCSSPPAEYAHLRTFPNVSGMLGVLFDQGEDARSHNSVSLTEILVDLYMNEGSILCQVVLFTFFGSPCNVSVIDCSSFSSSSVRDNGRWACEI